MQCKMKPDRMLMVAAAPSSASVDSRGPGRGVRRVVGEGGNGLTISSARAPTSRSPRPAQLDGFDLRANVLAPRTIASAWNSSAATFSGPRWPKTGCASGPT